MANIDNIFLRKSHFSQLDNWSPKKESIPDFDFELKSGMQSTSDKQKT
jgi:hypothetical protein